MNCNPFPFFLLFGCAVCLQAADLPLPEFRAVTLDDEIGIGYGLGIADVDGDGKDDILLVDKDVIAWYRNPSWSRHILARDLTERDHVCIAARDIDGDGRAEVAVGADWNPGDTEDSGSVHYLFAPEDRTALWKPVLLPKEPTVHRMRWVKSAGNAHQLVVVPLHGRGNRAGEGAGVRILAYTKPADPTQPWKTQLVDDTLHVTHNFDPVNWDDDPEEEMLVAAREGVFLLDHQGGAWKRTQLGRNEINGAGEVRLGELPGGRRFFATVEPIHGNTIAVYTPPAGGNGLWNRQVIDETVVDAHAVATGDLAGVGSDQLVVGWRAMNRPPNIKVGVKLFTPLDETGKRWRETLIDDNGMACEDVRLADLNGDGRLDIIAAGRATKNLKVYWNEGAR